MPHVVLAGDSIFDNGVYIAPGEPPVIAQVEVLLPPGSRATLLAVDGAVATDVPAQVMRTPKDATHIVVSVGGNDALGHLSMLTESARSVAEVFGRIAAIGERFEADYGRMLDAVLRRGLPTALCAIYYPRFEDPGMQRLAVAGLATFNDCILRAAIAHGLPVLDLRRICDELADYANPIEPSAAGGAKIARAIQTLVAEHDFSGRRAVIYG
jgi:hypothetical protein